MKGSFSATIITKKKCKGAKQEGEGKKRVKSTNKPSVSFGSHTCFIHLPGRRTRSKEQQRPLALGQRYYSQ